MKKVWILASAAHTDQVLHRLQALGLVHLVPLKPPHGEELETARRQLATFDQALASIREVPLTAPSVEPLRTRTLDTAEALLQPLSTLDKLQTEKQRLKEQLERLSGLGLNDPKDVHHLKEHGVHIRFYQCPRKECARWLMRPDVYVLGFGPDQSRFLSLISSEAGASLPLPEIHPGERSLSDLQESLVQTDTQIKEAQARQRELAGYKAQLQKARGICQDHVHLAEAKASLRTAGEVICLRGYCPADQQAQLQHGAARAGWGLVLADPGPEETVPTLIQARGWARWFVPVMRFLGILPGYREFDLNGLFLVFFTVFFSLIVGDAGYGLLMLGATWLFTRLRPGALSRETTRLFYLLGTATLVWGSLTGLWFAVPALAARPPLSLLVVPALSGDAGASAVVLRLCLLLGAVHLTLAHLWAGVRKGFPAGLADLGSVSMIWGLYWVAAQLVLGDAPAPQTLGCLLGGLLLVVLFSRGEQEKKVGGRKAGWVSLGRIPLHLLNVVSTFSDLVSYVRLFAVGIATKEVAVAFNDLAAGIGLQTPIAVVGYVLVVVFGHTLNLLLAAMGVLVHGVRLNLLEFSRHLEIGWAGRPYQPFRLFASSTRGASLDNE